MHDAGLEVRIRRRAMSYMIALLIINAVAASAFAQSAAPITPPHPGGFFNLQQPGQLSLTLFGGGFLSDEYGVTQQGFQLEQSVTHYVAVVGRVTGYQLFIGHGFDNPLVPGTGYHARYNFARFQGGIDLMPFEGTNLFILGGADAGDSSAGVVEGDLSTWLLMRSRHPFNIDASTIYDSQNQIISSEVDLRAVFYSTEKIVLMAGGGGAIYGGGFVHGAAGQGGPILGIYLPGWKMGADTQVGYGSSRQYGQLSIYKQFSWTE